MSMAGYTKLFTSILASTIWRADDKVRIVWITLLAMADKHGIAEGSVPGLADFAHVSVEDCERALLTLLSPDPYSRSKTAQGRRIATVPGGWKLINYELYRQTMSADERREYLRVKQAEYRAREKDRNRVKQAKYQPREKTRNMKRSQGVAGSTGRKQTVDKSTNINSVDTSIEHRAEAKSREQRAESRSQEQRAEAEEAPPPKSPPLTARSKRPIFTGQRLTVFEWQLEDCLRTLGPHADTFDVHEWFFAVDAKALNEGVVIPKRETGDWLIHQLVAEARRRGLPLTLATIDQPSPYRDTRTAEQQAASVRALLDEDAKQEPW